MTSTNEEPPVTDKEEEEEEGENTSAPVASSEEPPTATALKVSSDVCSNNDTPKEPYGINTAPAASSSAAAVDDEETKQQQEEGQPPPPAQKQAVVAPLPLEWTRMAECAANPDQNPANTTRYAWDVTDIDPNETELIVVGTAGEKITRMGHDLHTHVSPNMTHLVLRSHLIRTVSVSVAYVICNTESCTLHSI